MDEQISIAAEVIWGWLPVNEVPKQSDMIFVLGNSSNELPYEAARLYNEGLAPIVVVSGGRGRISKNDKETEAARYVKVLLSSNVPKTNILSEDCATNTAENIRFGRKLLEDHGIEIIEAIAITTPLLSRRHKATLERQWPNVSWILHTPSALSFEERIQRNNVQDFLNLIVGEVDRLQHYPAKGYIDKNSIPKTVIVAKSFLQEAGYTEQVISL